MFNIELYVVFFWFFLSKRFFLCTKFERRERYWKKLSFSIFLKPNCEREFYEKSKVKNDAELFGNLIFFIELDHFSPKDASVYGSTVEKPLLFGVCYLTLCWIWNRAWSQIFQVLRFCAGKKAYMLSEYDEHVQFYINFSFTLVLPRQKPLVFPRY